MYPLESTYRVICCLQSDLSPFPVRKDSLFSREGFHMHAAPDSFWDTPERRQLFLAEVIATSERIPVFGLVLYTHRPFIISDDEDGEVGQHADWVHEWRERGGPPLREAEPARVPLASAEAAAELGVYRALALEVASTTLEDAAYSRRCDALDARDERKRGEVTVSAEE